jgi:MFS family permease
MSAGSFAGAIAAGPISDHLGRRYAIMIACCIWVVGAAIQCSTHSVAQLVAGRVVSGIAGTSFFLFVVQLTLTDHFYVQLALPLHKSLSTLPSSLQLAREDESLACNNGQSNGVC